MRGTVGNGPQRTVQRAVLAVSIALLVPAFSLAQQPPAAQPLICESNAGERNVCPADTSAGVALMKSIGPAACLLGKTWGYDDAGVWVADGCGGEFQLGKQAVAGAPVQAAPAPAAPGPRKPSVRVETWGEFDPGDGFLVGRNSAGELSISAYALLRYINQFPGEQTFTDHLGNEHPVDGRNDIYPHRS